MKSLNQFISKHVTNRDVSMFSDDIESNRESLFNKIKDKSVLVIGGDGTIGSSYIRALLPFKPKSLVVVDIATKAVTQNIAIPNPGCGVAGDVRPWGVTVYKGDVYIGLVCSGQTAGGGDMQFFVQKSVYKQYSPFCYD